MDNRIVFSSDSHYQHENIIKYSNRPFANVDEMNTALVNGINKMLPSGGLLYHLGDWSMSSINFAFEFKDRLNKDIEIILLEGNHDENKLKDSRFRSMFKEIHKLLEVKVNGQRMTLCHYALRVWNKSHHKAWCLFGHSHGSLPDDANALSYDIGVDVAYKHFGEFRPFTFQEIADIMSKKTFKSVDHHGRE